MARRHTASPTTPTPSTTPYSVSRNIRNGWRDTTIRVAERMYTMGSLDRFRGFNLPGEHQCARNDLLEESS